MLDPQALRAVAAIARTGSVAGAADDLGFTPSAVSQQVKRLAQQVGTPLTTRVGRGVVLTAAGQALADSAPDVFAAMEHAADAARRRASAVAGMLRVAAFSTAVRGLLAPRLTALQTRHPALDIAVDELDPAPAVASLASGGADLVLVHDLDGVAIPLPTGVRTRHVHTDVGDLIVRLDHPLAERTQLSNRDLAGQVWITSPPGTACHDWFQQLLTGVEANPHVRHRVDDFSTQVALVDACGLAALIPRLARPALPTTLRAVSLEPPPTRRVDAVWRASSDNSPALHAVLACLTGAFEHPGQPTPADFATGPDTKDVREPA